MRHKLRSLVSSLAKARGETGDRNLSPRRASLNRPQDDRVAVLDEDAIAGDHRVGICAAVGDLVLGDLLVRLAVRREDEQLRRGRECEKDRAGVNDGAVASLHAHPAHASAAGSPAARRSWRPTAAPTAARRSRRSPRGLPILGADGEEVVALAESEDGAVLDHRRVELYGCVGDLPQLRAIELVAFLFKL